VYIFMGWLFVVVSRVQAAQYYLEGCSLTTIGIFNKLCNIILRVIFLWPLGFSMSFVYVVTTCIPNYKCYSFVKTMSCFTKKCHKV
jgi:hypothetical protein